MSNFTNDYDVIARASILGESVFFVVCSGEPGENRIEEIKSFANFYARGNIRHMTSKEIRFYSGGRIKFSFPQEIHERSHGIKADVFIEESNEINEEEWRKMCAALRNRK